MSTHKSWVFKTPRLKNSNHRDDGFKLVDVCLGTVLSVLRGIGAKRVLDLGCGEGKLLRLLLGDSRFEHILGMDVSWRSIEIANDRLKLNQMGEKQRARVELIQGSLMYRDKRLEGYGAAAVVEVIEHLDGTSRRHRLQVTTKVLRPEGVGNMSRV